MPDFLRLSLFDLAAALRTKKFSASELREAVLARIDATHADLNAVVAATMRVGFSRAGLLVGMQIIGPGPSQRSRVRASRAFERECPRHPEWPVR